MGTAAEFEKALESEQLHLELVLETAPFYRVSSSRAAAIVSEVKAAIRPWRGLARKLELPDYEIELMVAAFSTT